MPSRFMYVVGEVKVQQFFFLQGINLKKKKKKPNSTPHEIANFVRLFGFYQKFKKKKKE